MRTPFNLPNANLIGTFLITIIAASIREFHASFLRAVRHVNSRHQIHDLQVVGLVALRRAIWNRQALPECARRKQPHHEVNLI